MLLHEFYTRVKEHRCIFSRSFFLNSISVLLLYKFVKSLRLYELPHKEVAREFCLTTLEVSVEVKEVIGGFEVVQHLIFAEGFFVKGFLLFARPIVLNIVSDCFQQEVEKELLDT